PLNRTALLSSALVTMLTGSVTSQNEVGGSDPFLRESCADMMPLDPAVLPSRPEFGVHVTENMLVPMRDGIRLATAVYRPACDGRPLDDARPVLLHRTPYNKTETEATMGQCRWFAARGYVVVNQDCRGCFRSEGEVNFLAPEAEDGVDTIAWIRRQEWS